MSIRMRLSAIEKRRRGKCVGFLVAHDHRDGSYTLNGVHYANEAALRREASRHPNQSLFFMFTPENDQPPPELASRRHRRGPDS